MTNPITLIVATSQNGVIGKDNGLPWHLPRDLQYFKRITTGCPIIMGRKTYESIGQALPNRLNIVITRNSQWRLDDAEVAHDLVGAIALARAQQSDACEIHIIGGATLFSQALAQNLVDKLYINRVLADIDGDTFFPEIDWGQWERLSCTHHEADEKNAYALDFEVYSQRPEEDLHLSANSANSPNPR